MYEDSEEETPIEETYFFMFSSPVPVHLVPSIWQAFHDGIAYVAARMSPTTSAFSSSMRWFDDTPPVFVIVGVETAAVLVQRRCYCDCDCEAASHG